MSDAAEPRPDGFTLVELIVSLALFALIAVAGLALVDSVLGVEGRTSARLDRLSDVQRTMMVVQGDLDQIAGGEVTGEGATLRFRRAAPGLGGVPVEVVYAVRGGVLVRQTGGVPQVLLTGVGALGWRFFDGNWIERWPRADAKAWPRAVAMELTLADRGPVRRVVALPVRPKDGP